MDYVDEIFNAAGVHGIHQVGAIVPVGYDEPAQMQRPVGAPPPSPPFGRSGRYVYRRAPLGFPTLSVPANGTQIFITQQVSRVYHPDRLLIIPAAPGLVIDSIRVGDEEQTVTPGAAVELYGVEALTDRLPDNFSPVQTGTTVSVQLRNTTAAPIAVTMGMKGGVER